MLDFIILGMVQKDCLTGYDIKKRIEAGVGVFYKASYGSLYPALKRLAAKGYLESSENHQGSRKKIFYHTTSEGDRIFHDWLQAPIDVMDGTNTHLAKVYFFDRLSPNVRDRQLLEFEVNYESYLVKLKSLEHNFEGMENRETFYYKLSTLYYGICVTREIIRWCKLIRSGEPLENLVHISGEEGSW